MDRIKVIGKHDLSGKIYISGSKNSVVSLLPAAILSDETVIEKVPHISDVDNLEEILRYLNVKFSLESGTIHIDSRQMINVPITEDYSSKLRASYYFMGAMLGKFKKVEISFPGGCNIGARSFDFHLKGFEKLGARVTTKDNLYIIEAEELKGATINLPFPSVGATVNILLAAVLANGKTIINNAASEPEIGNLIEFLISMGAQIKGANTNRLEIDGVTKLSGGKVKVIPDRIEAGTYIIAGALIGDNLKINNIIPDHIESLTSKLTEIGIPLEIGSDYVIVSKANKPKCTNVKTLVYPGFATDLQQPLTTLLTQCNGTSSIEETIWENRFLNTEYLNKMGANITVNGKTALIKGPTKLIGKKVIATDLRAGACLILAGLIAKGETTIENVEHILRGYEKIIEKLTNVGAKISLEEI